MPEIVFPKNFFTASDLNIGLIEGKTGSSIDLSKPIEVPFTVSLDAKPGGHILEGRIKYFARSPQEDWCYKTTSKFSVAFSTRTTVIQEKIDVYSKPFRSYQWTVSRMASSRGQRSRIRGASLALRTSATQPGCFMSRYLLLLRGWASR